MNRLSIFIAIQTLFVLLLVGCQKTDSVLNPQNTNPPTSSDSTMTLEEAQQIFTRQSDKLSHSRTAGDGEVNDKMDFEKRPLWSYATKEKFKDGTQVVIAPLENELPNNLSAVISTQATLKQKSKTNAQVFTTHKAVVYKDKGKETVEIMSVIGEEDYKAKNTYFDNDQIFTGALLFHDLNNKFLRGFYYDKGKYIGRLDKPKKNGRTTGCYWTETVSVFYYTVSSGGIQYQSATPNGDVRVTMTLYCDDSPPYNPYMTTTNTNNSGGASTGSSASTWIANAYQQQSMFNQLFTFETADKNFIVANDHLKCFNNVTGSTCTITLHIDQPINGSSAALNPSTTHLVGHAFLTFQQIMPNGTVFRSSIGFYPEGGGQPWNPSGTPKFKDDGAYTGSVDVSTTFAVTPSEMMNVVNYVKSYDNAPYHLKYRNCGNMCVSAMGQIGVNLPTSWTAYPWYPDPQKMNISPSPWVLGPSIGKFGEQMKNYSNSNITNTNNSKSKSGNCN